MNAGIRILLAADDSTMLARVGELLGEGGLRNIEPVAGIEAAGAALEAGTFDIVIAGWGMSGLTGSKLLATFRADPKSENVPVILFSSEATRENILEAARAGVDAFIVEPFDADVLRSKIDSILDPQPEAATG